MPALTNDGARAKGVGIAGGIKGTPEAGGTDDIFVVCTSRRGSVLKY